MTLFDKFPKISAFTSPLNYTKYSFCIIHHLKTKNPYFLRVNYHQKYLLLTVRIIGVPVNLQPQYRHLQNVPFVELRRNMFIPVNYPWQGTANLLS